MSLRIHGRVTQFVAIILKWTNRPIFLNEQHTSIGYTRLEAMASSDSRRDSNQLYQQQYYVKRATNTDTVVAIGCAHLTQE